MSNAITNNLSREKIQLLLAAVGSEATEDSAQMDATEYDWNQPHCFSSDQLRKLDDFTKRLAAAMAEKFAALCNSDFDVTIASSTQHFADKFLSQTSEGESQLAANYNLGFGADRNHQCGFISIPPQTAVIWTTQLLGETESKKNSDKDLSQLEESLLVDIASAVIKALSDSLRSYDFHPSGSIVRGSLPLELQGLEVFCKITFNVKKTDSENSSEAYLLIPSSRLEPVVGKTTQDDNKFSAEDISKAILDHLQQMPVSVTAQLVSTMLSFEEIMGLQVDDIVLLDKRIDEPVELIVGGRTFIHGQPAKSAGKYAVVVTATALQYPAPTE